MKICVVVDGYSSGNLYPHEIKSRGFEVVHVQSTAEVWPLLLPTYRPDDYSQHFVYTGNLEKLYDSIGKLDPICVIAGTETGVELADALSEKLNLTTSNGTKFSEARRDKFLMIEAVRKAGLLAAKQIKSSSVEEVLEFVKREKLSRVVIKPLKSAGADSVAICDSENEIRVACQNILGTVNQIGIPNSAVLCQEFLKGTEYAIDAVTMGGQTHFTAIWKYFKVSVNGGDFVYDRDELVSCTDDNGKKLCDYVRGVLGALEVKHGPSHAEVMMTERGPALVEIGTRLNGTTTPDLHRDCVGYGQLDLAVDGYLDEESFKKKSLKPYVLKKHAYSVSLISEKDGIVKSIPGEKIIRKFSSLNELRLRAKPGYHLKKTVDYFTTPGFVMLVHESQEVLDSDLKALRNLEKSGLFELELLQDSRK